MTSFSFFYLGGMKSMRFLGIVLVISFVCFCSLATADELQISPVNPEFEHYLNSSSVQEIGNDSHYYGDIPSPVDLSYLNGQNVSAMSDTYPSSYDLRSQGFVTSVKDQGQCGSCWAFATYGSLESELLVNSNKTESRNFSENNLKNTHGFDWGPCYGGNEYMSMAYLNRYSGPINETDDPYIDNATIPSPINLTVQKHLQEEYLIPAKTSPLDNGNIKNALMAYGAVHANYYHYDIYLNGSYYYNPVSTKTNHAVTIVGWDDSVSPSLFSTPPPGPGAWLVKNSWGTSWGMEGYYWVSYYDGLMGYKTVAVYPGIYPVSNYDTVYQYDPFGWIGNYGYDDDSAWGANAFTAKTNETLEGVSFYTNRVNAAYHLYIFTNTATPPVSTAGSVYNKSGTILYPGYHTVALDKPVPLNASESFVVAIRYTSPGYNYPIPSEYRIIGYSSNATAGVNESFIRHNENSAWEDLGSSDNSNICIKAFTLNSTPVPVNPSVTGIAPSSGLNNQSYPVLISGSNFQSGALAYLISGNYSLMNESGVQVLNSSTISTSFNLTNEEPGIYTVKVKNPDTLESSENVTFVIWEAPAYYTINATANNWSVIQPAGNGTYQKGANSTYITEPKPGADLTDVKIDSVSGGTNQSWTFTNITEDHNITAIGNPTPGQVHVFFGPDNQTGTAPFLVNFTDMSLGTPNAWYWQFGDGANATDQNASHIYDIPGSYTVVLRASNNNTGGSGVWHDCISVKAP